MAAYIFFYSYSFGILIGTLVILFDNFVQKQYQTFGETIRLWLLTFIEPFLYHPLLVFFSLKGYFNFFTSKKMEWGTMTRQGFDNKSKTKTKEIPK